RPLRAAPRRASPPRSARAVARVPPPPRPRPPRRRRPAPPPEAARATGTGAPRRPAAARSPCVHHDRSEGFRLFPRGFPLLVELEQGEQRDRLGHAVGALHRLVERELASP